MKNVPAPLQALIDSKQPFFMADCVVIWPLAPLPQGCGSSMSGTASPLNAIYVSKANVYVVLKP